jgi:hypothetical protein
VKLLCAVGGRFDHGIGRAQRAEVQNTCELNRIMPQRRREVSTEAAHALQTANAKRPGEPGRQHIHRPSTQ